MLKEKNVLKTAENVPFSLVCTDDITRAISWDDVAKLKKHRCQTEKRNLWFPCVLQYCLSIVLIFLKLLLRHNLMFLFLINVWKQLASPSELLQAQMSPCLAKFDCIYECIISNIKGGTVLITVIFLFNITHRWIQTNKDNSLDIMCHQWDLVQTCAFPMMSNQLRLPQQDSRRFYRLMISGNRIWAQFRLS